MGDWYNVRLYFLQIGVCVFRTNASCCTSSADRCKTKQRARKENENELAKNLGRETAQLYVRLRRLDILQRYVLSALLLLLLL